MVGVVLGGLDEGSIQSRGCRVDRTHTEPFVGDRVPVRWRLFDNGFEFVDIEPVVGVLVGARHGPVPLLLHLEDQLAEILDLHAHISKHTTPQLFPFHRQLHLLLNTPQSSLDLCPALKNRLHLHDDCLETVRADLIDILT